MGKSYPAKHHYTGSSARGYEETRSWTEQWRREQRIVARLLEHVPPGAVVLDLPVGTGRYAGLYAERGLHALGIDFSPDMLREARSRASWGLELLVRGEAERLPLRSGSVDYVVCTRFLNWLPRPALEQVARELRRTTRSGLLIHVHTTDRMALRSLLGILARELRRHPLRALRSVLGSLRRLVRPAPRRLAYSRPRGTGEDAGWEHHSYGSEEVQRLFAAQGWREEESVLVDERVAYEARELRRTRIHRLVAGPRSPEPEAL